ncbi:MAG: hypothetical protein JSW41_05645, partial [Candidatus Aenigmatarchaeota archaeon]
MNEREQQEFKHMMITAGGLMCDNPDCDWEDETVKVADYPKWLNASCPKCGENVLTEEDLNTHLAMTKMMQALGNMDSEKLEQMGEEMLEQLRLNAVESQDTELIEKYETLASLKDLPENTA